MTALPQIFVDRTEAFLTGTGTIVFHVGEEHTYSIRMGNTTEPVVEGKDAESDLEIFLATLLFPV